LRRREDFTKDCLPKKKEDAYKTCISGTGPIEKEDEFDEPRIGYDRAQGGGSKCGYHFKVCLKTRWSETHCARRRLSTRGSGKVSVLWDIA